MTENVLKKTLNLLSAVCPFSKMVLKGFSSGSNKASDSPKIKAFADDNLNAAGITANRVLFAVVLFSLLFANRLHRDLQYTTWHELAFEILESVREKKKM